MGLKFWQWLHHPASPADTVQDIKAELLSYFGGPNGFLTKNAEELTAIQKQLEEITQKMSAQQSAIDALTASLGVVAGNITQTQTDVAALAVGVTALETALTNFQNANPALDLTALTAAVANVSTLSGNAETSANAAVAELPAPAPTGGTPSGS